MSYRPEREKRGFAKVWCRGDTSCYVLARNEYEPLVAAWHEAKRGQRDPLYEAIDLYGDPMTIDLLDVRVIADSSPGSLAAFDVEEDERRAYERTHGED